MADNQIESNSHTDEFLSEAIFLSESMSSGASCGPPSPSQHNKSLDDDQLNHRMRHAIAHSMAELNEGDTLAFLNYPKGGTIYTPDGFPVSSEPRRVHSSKLRNTKSDKIIGMFTDRQQQRIRRSKSFLNMLPPGIRYVIDLTPPEEGEEAVELLENLHCSEGIRKWYLSEGSFGVPHHLVGGREMSREKPLPQADSTATGHSSWTKPASTLGSLASGRYSQEGYLGAGTPGTTPVADPTLLLKLKHNPIPLDYCRIRHCESIDTLLRIIEGKNYTLDSAVKVWTLFAAAKYFGVTHLVRDPITTWMCVSPNCHFIEAHPEDALNLGLGLQSPMLTQFAFSILVSEAALAKAAYVDREPPVLKDERTRFLREKQDIDEDVTNIVQAAADNFLGRVVKVKKELTDASVFYLDLLPEFFKLRQLESRCRETNMHSIASVQTFMESLRVFVRGVIVSVLQGDLPADLITMANAHRAVEHHTTTCETDFQSIWTSLSDDERIMTKLFWFQLKETNLSIKNFANTYVDEYDHWANHNIGLDNLTDIYEIPSIHMANLRDGRDAINRLIFSCFSKQEYERYEPIPKIEINYILNRCNGPHEDDDDITHPLYMLGMTLGENTTTLSSELYSPFFSLNVFFQQVTTYVRQICNRMLSNGEVDFRMVTDTLLSLDRDEYKFLPLWAGGNEDGTGGVHDPEIPPAQLGAIGPGPGYHTGFSTTSDMGTDGNWTMDDYATSTLDTSVMVENGYTDHIHRYAVASVDESFTASDDTLSIPSPLRSKDPGPNSFAVDGVDDSIQSKKGKKPDTESDENSAKQPERKDVNKDQSSVTRKENTIIYNLAGDKVTSNIVDNNEADLLSEVSEFEFEEVDLDFWDIDL